MKRVITIILAMAMALSIFSVAYADESRKHNQRKPTTQLHQGQLPLRKSEVNMSFNVENAIWHSPIDISSYSSRSGGFIVSAAASDATAADNGGIR